MKLVKRTALPLAIAMLIGNVAYAQSGEAVSKEIDVRSFDLSTVDGTKEALRNIEAAARDMCGVDRGVTGTRIRSRYARECVESAMDQAVKSLGSELLANTYESKAYH